MRILKCFRPNGEIRGIWNDQTGPGFRTHGAIPQRASRVEVIQEGPSRGMFYVDFSPLADITGDDRYRCCLAEVFESYSRAVATEVEWLTKYWVLGEPG